MTPAAGPGPAETVSGVIERATFHHPDNGFCVLRARGHRHLVTVIGHAATVGPGEWIAEWLRATGTPP